MKYIIVDDDSFSTMLTNIVIEDAVGASDIKIFNIPQQALNYIKDAYSTEIGTTILLLDINMPEIDGWEFLKHYEKFSDLVKLQISIFMISSSLDKRDQDRAETNQYVKGFISKPLESKTIILITDVALADSIN
jgi:CheY-like chemotaxis protein